MKPTWCIETGIDCLNSYQLLYMFCAACKMEGASLTDRYIRNKLRIGQYRRVTEQRKIGTCLTLVTSAVQDIEDASCTG